MKITEIEEFEAKLRYLVQEIITEHCIGQAFPIVPLDDDGNPERYEPGCVPWNVCQSVEVTSVKIKYAVLCEVNWKWSQDDDEDSDESVLIEACFSLENGQFELDTHSIEVTTN